MIMQRQFIAGDKKDIYYSKVIYNIARENSINSKQIGNIYNDIEQHNNLL